MVLLAAALTLSAVHGLVVTAVARADVCDAVPSLPLVPNPAKIGCKAAIHPVRTIGRVAHVVTHPVQAIGHVVAAPLRAAGDQVMQGITSWVESGAAWLVGQAGKLINQTTTPRLQSPWFLRQYGTMAALAAVFALPLLLVSVLQGVVRRDGGVIVRAALVHLPLAFALTAMAVVIVELFLGLTDAMAGQVAGSVGSDAEAFFKDTAKALGAVLLASGGTSPLPLFAVFLGALVAAVGAFFVWIELLIRSAAIYVAVLFLPFTFVAMIWPATQRWCRRLIELLAAIILAKFVIVAIMALAAAGLGHSRSHDAFNGVLAGTALMLLAAFSPFALLKLIPLAEGAAHAAGSHRGAGASTLGPTASPGAVMRRALDANWGTAGGTPALAGAGAGAHAGAGTGAGAGAGMAGAGASAAQAGGQAAGSRAQNIGGAATRTEDPTTDGAADPQVDGGLGGQPAGAGSAGRSGGESGSPASDSPPPAPDPGLEAMRATQSETPAPPVEPAREMPRPADREAGL